MATKINQHGEEATTYDDVMAIEEAWEKGMDEVDASMAIWDKWSKYLNASARAM